MSDSQLKLLLVSVLAWAAWKVANSRSSLNVGDITQDFDYSPIAILGSNGLSGYTGKLPFTPPSGNGGKGGVPSGGNGGKAPAPP